MAQTAPSGSDFIIPPGAEITHLHQRSALCCFIAGIFFSVRCVKGLGTRSGTTKHDQDVGVDGALHLSGVEVIQTEGLLGQCPVRPFGNQSSGSPVVQETLLQTAFLFITVVSLYVVSTFGVV